MPAWNGQGNVPYYDATPQLLPSQPPTRNVAYGNYAGPPLVAQTIPAGSNNFTLTFSSTPPLNGGQEILVSVDWWDASGNTTGGVTVGGSAGQNSDSSSRIAIPANSVYWAAFASQIDNTDKTVTASFSFYCAGQSTTAPETPCCPPDPLLTNYLNMIYAKLLQIEAELGSSSGGVVPPVSWSDGTRHAGLSGAGSFIIDPKAIGVRFEVTTPPSSPQVLPGDPDFYWNMGFVTPIALSSPLRGWRLVFLKQSFELPEFTDSIGYTLLEGTVVTAVELLPVYPQLP